MIDDNMLGWIYISASITLIDLLAFRITEPSLFD
jgi:hypothetical protein